MVLLSIIKKADTHFNLRNCLLVAARNYNVNKTRLSLKGCVFILLSYIFFPYISARNFTPLAPPMVNG